MRTISRKMRGWIVGAVLVLACLLVWWVRIYSPMRDQLQDMSLDQKRASDKRDLLTEKLKKLSQDEKNPQKTQEELARYANLVVDGQSVEEINASTQARVQAFLESHEIPLRAYKELTPSKWKEYAEGRVEFTLSTTTQGLSDLLAFLEKLDKVIRIERLTVSQRRIRGGSELNVSLQLGTLFVEQQDQKNETGKPETKKLQTRRPEPRKQGTWIPRTRKPEKGRAAHE